MHNFYVLEETQLFVEPKEKDALFLLENNGLNVKLQGFGAVKKQSLEAGTKFFKGSQIVLTLG